jgi:hypothetical protein
LSNASISKSALRICGALVAIGAVTYGAVTFFEYRTYRILDDVCRNVIPGDDRKTVMAEALVHDGRVSFDERDKLNIAVGTCHCSLKLHNDKVVTPGKAYCNG